MLVGGVQYWGYSPELILKLSPILGIQPEHPLTQNHVNNVMQVFAGLDNSRYREVLEEARAAIINNEEP